MQSPQKPLLLPEAPDPKCWADEHVGYGVLLPESSHTAAQKAVGDDAAEPVRRLLAHRPGTVMLRWDAELLPYKSLRRYYTDGTPPEKLRIGLSGFGTSRARLPRYIVIIGGPESIPWQVQYDLGTRHAVGRLPLSGTELNNYINALLTDWQDADVDAAAPLMWTVDLPGDITAEMRAVIANPLAANLTDPVLSGFQHITDGEATCRALLDRLRSTRPALVFTSSHGMTDITTERLAMTLGLPVDTNYRPVALDDLDAAMPGGAIWHAQACCSAGSEGPTSKYAGLLATNTTVATVVNSVAALGPTVAPAVQRLLGRESPVRAMIGHVEPTFDWTLRVAETGQGLGYDITSALSTNLYGGQPIGYAFSDYRAGVGELHTQWHDAYERLAEGFTKFRPILTRLRLTALDRQSMVLLGDPTVTLPALSHSTPEQCPMSAS